MPDSPQQILTFYSPHHTHHAPTVEFLHGHLVPYFEKPERIETIKQALTDASLIALREDYPLVSRETLSATHSADMLAYLEALSGQVMDIVRSDMDIYDMGDQVGDDPYYYEHMFPPCDLTGHPNDPRGYFVFDSVSPIGRGTWQAVQHSASLAAAGAEALLAGERRAYALCRPPGHHAGYDFMGGYCYINNAVVAANRLRDLGRVAVLDIDYHAGNGTQAMLWDEPEMLFASIHADPSIDYPHYAGYADETGVHGTIVNYPLPYGTDGAAYLNTLNQALARITDFGAVALVVSLGFDTYKDDPMAHFALETADYTPIAAAIAALNLPTLYVQEGGYAIGALQDASVAFFRGVSGCLA